ncbi:hypothetical protein [Ruminococcus albus]|uniref:Lipoprotein n=1 Tax=Ruminococcus albus TaxID=1264 RepID=A0A1H7NQQ7_RUMAL|nr:hypothetical protein [Ruminococcus albus]SEL25661.1 hypothetical protein SAMN05216469_11644 [Ruminococcus albus]
MKIYKLAAVLTAAVLAFSCTACSQKNSKKSKSAKKHKTSSIVGNESAADEIVTDGEADSVTSQDGVHIKQAYDLLKSDQYRIKLTYTDASGNETEITRLKDGDNYYELQTNEIGTSGFITVDGTSYDFDNVCGIYRKKNSAVPVSVIETVVEQDLPATDTHINAEDAKIYDVEEYTYTGGSYITVMDFYFDKETGLPAKYTTTYMVEAVNGDEGMTETRTINEISYGSEDELLTTDGQTKTVDKSVFDLSFLSGLVDFGVMTPEQKLGYCQAIFVTSGVSAEELSSAAMNDEKLKNISYEELTSLVYTYGDKI